MIEGLKVTVTGPKLRDLCFEQAAFHAGRAAFYKEQYDKVKEACAAVGDANPQLSNLYSSGGNDPKMALSERRKTHEDAARELDFIAQHLNTAEIYVLGQSDLATLGIRRNRGF